MIKDGADAAVPYFALQAYPLIEAGRLAQRKPFQKTTPIQGDSMLKR